jgi:hypothetical protein
VPARRQSLLQLGLEAIGVRQPEASRKRIAKHQKPRRSSLRRRRNG